MTIARGRVADETQQRACCLRCKQGWLIWEHDANRLALCPAWFVNSVDSHRDPAHKSAVACKVL